MNTVEVFVMTSESSDVDGLHICIRMPTQRDVMMGVMVLHSPTYSDGWEGRRRWATQ